MSPTISHNMYNSIGNEDFFDARTRWGSLSSIFGFHVSVPVLDLTIFHILDFF